jgi:hypothetical protein
MDHAGVSTQSCAQCGAPLAEDQRYCLHCGEPRPGVKGPLSSGPLADTRALTPASPPGVPSSPPGVPFSPPGVPSIPGAPGSAGPASTGNNSVALIAGVGVLLLAMGIGVLIGRAGSGSAKAAPAQVITVGGAGGGGAGTGTTSTPTTTTPEPAKEAKKKKEEQEGKAPPGTGNSLSKPAPPSTLKNLRKGGSGQSFEQRSKNLPNVVGT